MYHSIVVVFVVDGMAATILPCAEETCLTGAPLFVVAVANAVAALYVLQDAVA